MNLLTSMISSNKDDEINLLTHLIYLRQYAGQGTGARLQRQSAPGPDAVDRAADDADHFRVAPEGRGDAGGVQRVLHGDLQGPARPALHATGPRQRGAATELGTRAEGREEEEVGFAAVARARGARGANTDAIPFSDCGCASIPSHGVRRLPIYFAPSGAGLTSGGGVKSEFGLLSAAAKTSR